MNDDTIIQQRVSGRSARAIARAQGCTLAEVSKVLDRFTETTIDDKVRKHTLALELARLDELQETFYTRALEGDVACGALITKIIERPCTMLGLYTPQTATLKPSAEGNVNRAPPRGDRSHPWQDASGRFARRGSGRSALHAL